jgi:F-type H+-transporting ATPase subunit gamma
MFVEKKDIKVVDIVFVTADKGLCGGFNMATIKQVNRLLKEYEDSGVKVRLRVIGRKGYDYFTFQGREITDYKVGLSSSPNYEEAAKFIAGAVEDFLSDKTDKVILIHNGFLNMLSQEIKQVDLLPVSLCVDENEPNSSILDIEPEDEEEVLKELTQKYLDFNIYYALIDSLAAEHSARMQAMDNATNNAKDRVESLTIEFNKARQAAITTELIEIISGVESLK